MKYTRIIRHAVAVTALSLSPLAVAQVTVTTEPSGTAVTQTKTTVISGRVGTVSPDVLVMESASGTEPARYRYTERTTYVDDTGAVVPVSTLRAGVPVTVHYSRSGDQMLADRVIVHRQATTTTTEPAGRPPTVIKEQKTTTTTTTTEPVKKKKVEVDVDDDD
jgi:hypothetical protein